MLHPDRGGDAELFVKLHHAYSTLIDEELREKYVNDPHGEFWRHGAIVGT